MATYENELKARRETFKAELYDAKRRGNSFNAKYWARRVKQCDSILANIEKDST